MTSAIFRSILIAYEHRDQINIIQETTRVGITDCTGMGANPTGSADFWAS